MRFGGLQVGADTEDRPAPGFDRVEDGIRHAVLHDFIIAVAILLVDELNGKDGGILEPGVEVRNDVSA